MQQPLGTRTLDEPCMMQIRKPSQGFSVRKQPRKCNVRRRFVQVRLTLHEAGQARPTQSNFKLRAPLDLQITRLPLHFRRALLKHVLTDRPLRERLSSGNQAIELSSGLRIPNCPWGGISLKSDVRIDTLSDLFEDPNDPHLDIIADVTLRLQNVKGPAPLTMADRTIIPDLQPPQKRSILRIGNYPVHDEDHFGTQEVRQGSRKDAPAYCWPLLIHFDPTKLNNVRFTCTHAYDFNDFSIGDINESSRWGQLNYHASYRYFGPFSHVYWKGESRQKFVAQLKKYVEEEGESLGSGLPFLPTYCFNTYEPLDFSLGLTKWPNQGIDLAIRCVNHYKALKSVSFPRDIRLVIKQEDTREEICEFVEDEIDFKGYQDKLMVDSKRLFGEKHKGRWEMVFWVLPQIKGIRKIFRWDEGLELVAFLDGSDRVRKRDKKLYVEVCIVEKQGGSEAE